MSAAPARAACVLALAALLAGCARGGSEPPSLLVVTLDTTRPDHLGCYGGLPTPTLDALARGGVLFKEAIAQAPLTLPSHASIFTGLYPTTHGVHDNGRFVLDGRFQTLAEILAAHGFATGAAVGAFPVSARFGLNQGFSFYDDDLAAGRGSGALFRERVAGEVNKAALGWLAKAPPGRFFLWVHYFDPHQPYEPPSPYKERFRENPYDGEIAYVDAELGELLAAMAKLGRRDNTLVAVLGDHGEGLGDHEESSHGLFVYDATTHIPLILHPPRGLRKSVRPGTQVDTLVQAVDLMPTLLELLGIPVPEGLDGRSLVPLLGGRHYKSRAKSMAPGNAEAPGGDERYAYSETLYPWFGFGWSELRAVRDARWKYISAPRPELYDLEKDPQELRNLAASHPDEVSRLARVLDGIMARGRQQAAAPLDAATAARLRSLGYIGSASPAPAASVGAPPGAPDPKDMVQVYLLLMTGGDYMLHQDYARASSFLRRALDIDPKNELGRLYMAQTLLNMGAEQAALKEFRTLLEFDPASAEARVGVAVVLSHQGHEDEARHELDQAIAQRPGFGLAHYNLALLEEARGNLAGARDLLARCLQESPFLVEGWTQMGDLDYREGRLGDAQHEYEHALVIDAGHEAASRGLAAVAARDKESGGGAKKP